MAVVKISQLESLTSVTGGDLLLITDTESSKSHNISIDQLTSELTLGMFGDVDVSSGLTAGKILVWDGNKFVPDQLTITDSDGNVTLVLSVLENINSKMGVGSQEVNFGIFDGNILPDGSNLKFILQAIENQIEQIDSEFNIVEDEVGVLQNLSNATDARVTILTNEGNQIKSRLDIIEGAGYLTRTDTGIELDDNQNNAFQFAEGNNIYLKFNTFNSGEKVQILKDLWVSDGIHCADYVLLDGDNKELKFMNSGGGSYVGLKAPTGLSSDTVFTLPGEDGNDGQVLTTDGSGNFGWSTPTPSLNGLSDVNIGSPVSGQVLKYNGNNWVPAPDVDTDTNVDTSGLQATIDQLEATLNKLVPPAPSTFDGFNVSLTGTAGTYRICSGFTPNDNGGGVVVAGETVVVGRNRSVGTNVIHDVGPGDSGTVTLRLNGNPDSQHTMTSGVDNGTYGNLVISDNKDASQSTRDSGIVADFYQVYDVSGQSVSVNEGRNGIYFEHGSSQTQSAYWYEDATTNMTCALSFGTPNVVGGYSTNYSSGVPHYANGTEYVYTTNLSKITGDVYNTSNNVLTTSGSTAAFNNSGNYQYDDITGGSLPPPRNFGVNQNEQVINGVKVTTRDRHVSMSGNSAFRSHVLVTPYGNATKSPQKNVMINIMGNTARTDVIDEDNISVNMGTGSGNGIRVELTDGDTPTGVATVPTNSDVIPNHEATVVGGVLNHDQTNYQTYEPTGPDYSAGRSGDQYFTVKITRSQVSQFTINYTGSCSGCFVKMPNNSTWTTSLSSTNGWGDMFKSYKGSGVPSGSQPGVASGGLMDNNGGSFTCVFGTESSSNDTNNEILVRWKLTSGQSITTMSFSS